MPVKVKNAFLILMLTLATTAMAAGQDNREKPDGNPPVENFLDCTAFTWMQNCTETNRWVAQNPDKPLRINKSGIEFFFPPGTPSVTVDWVVNQTPQSLERYMQYMERSYAHHTRAAAMYRAALEARDGALKGFDGIDGIRKSEPYATLPKIKQNNVKLYVFYSSTCSACKLQEPHIAELRKRYPQMEISMLQINHDPSYVSRVNKTLGVPAVQLTAAQFAQYRARVNVTPTIWIEDKRSSNTDVVEGYVTLPDIVRHIARVSK